MGIDRGDIPLTFRPLAREDLPAVIAIDTSIEGRSRRTYVERRLAAALREPGSHAQFAACDAEGLAGYILARVLAGEFGRARPSLRLELVGVRPGLQRMGAGRRLFDMLAQWAQRHEIREMHTTEDWANVQVLGWLHTSGFRLAPEVVLDVDVERVQAAGDSPLTLPEGQGPANERNFGSGEGNDHERAASGAVEIRAMAPADLAAIARIDRAVTGRDRRGYIESLLSETTEAQRTRVSLAGRLDGAIVGFVMARADIGDYGRTEPVAVLDTIGIDPEYARRGIGRALVAQLAANVAQLQVERIETIVRVADTRLLGFFLAAGFAPAQRLAFVRRGDPAR